MHTYRFNPVFKRWVMVGPTIPERIIVKSAHLLSIGKIGNFEAASHPKDPFLLDPENRGPSGLARLFVDHQPLGEYELVLYKSKHDFWEWDAKIWHNWLQVVQQRIIQAYHKPRLNHVDISLNTALLDTIQGYQRAGDVVFTSHKLFENPELGQEMAKKIIQKESLYILHEDGFGAVYVPSAPTEELEVWYMPKQGSRLEACGKSERMANARILQKLVSGLHEEYPKNQFHLHIYTTIVEDNTDSLWWIRIHKVSSLERSLPIQASPEGFLKKLALSGKFRLPSR